MYLAAKALIIISTAYLDQDSHAKDREKQSTQRAPEPCVRRPSRIRAPRLGGIVLHIYGDCSGRSRPGRRRRRRRRCTGRRLGTILPTLTPLLLLRERDDPVGHVFLILLKVRPVVLDGHGLAVRRADGIPVVAVLAQNVPVRRQTVKLLGRPKCGTVEVFAFPERVGLVARAAGRTESSSR